MKSFLYKFNVKQLYNAQYCSPISLHVSGNQTVFNDVQFVNVKCFTDVMPKYLSSLKEVIDSLFWKSVLSIDLIGVVPDDEFIITQTNKGEPVVTNHKAPSGKAYTEIASRILGENVEITIPGKKEGFLEKIKNFFTK